MRYLIYPFLLLLSLSSCQKEPTADYIVNQAIEYAGGNQFESAEISFGFRDMHYKIVRNESNWLMSRSFQDSSLFIEDNLTTNGFSRKVNGQSIEVADSMAFKYSESINSVIYFALLPYKLNDQAVIKESLGEEEIEGNTYHKIKVRFKKEGGGEDYQDEFIYWFDKKDYSLDYLAYSFQVNGGGFRFRKAYNERFIKGIRFVDYVNYKPSDDSTNLNSLAKQFQDGILVELSEIELKKVEVNYLSN